MAKLTMVLLAVLYLTSNLYAGGFVLHSKRLPASSEIDSIEIFIDAGGNTFVVVRANRGAFYYLNDNLIDLEQYEDIWDVFLKDGHFHFYVQKNGNIHIYELTKDSGIKVVTSVDIKEALAGFSVPGTKMNVIPVPGQKDPYYLLASRWVFPVNPVEFLFDCASGGHGIYYVKPFLTEVRDGKLGKPQKLRYGGKIDETYYIKQVVQSGDFAHFLGFRQQEQRAWASPEIKYKCTPVILHHAAYDLKKKKVTQTNPIYTDTPRGEEDRGIWYRYDYGDNSIDAFGDDIFVTFSWEKLSHRMDQSGEQYVESNIFYWDRIQGKAGEVAKITDGFRPMVKADSLGNVHLLYVNNEANLMHKVKRKGIWQKEDVLVDRVDTKPHTKNIAAAFDKNNSLHVVYPSDGSLVHAVIKVN